MRWMGGVAGVALVVVATVTGCATSFTGSAHIEGGKTGCEAKCRGEGMQFAGMVFMGEYSSACVCEAPRPAAGASGRQGDATGGSSLLAQAAGASGGASGVMMQMRRQRQAQQAPLMR